VEYVKFIPTFLRYFAAVFKYLLKASYFRACNISLCCRDQKVKRKIREQQIGLYTYNDVAASRSINADCFEDRVRALTSKQDIFWAVQQ